MGFGFGREKEKLARKSRDGLQKAEGGLLGRETGPVIFGCRAGKF
jgi:hypothetical protein